jgi:hypothetical protein
MHRKPRINEELDALKERRDDLRIRISLLNDADTPDQAEIGPLERELWDLQERIYCHRAKMISPAGHHPRTLQ